MSASFAEVRIDAGFIIYGTSGGSGYNTNVVVVNSGRENRNKNWENSRGRWEYGQRKVSGVELHSIEGFFRARNGRYQGFRFKDWGNYKVTAEPLTEYNIVSQGVLLPVGESSTDAQLYKKIWDAATDLSDTTEYRKITKPIISDIPTIYKDGVELEHVTDWEIDQGTGIVTFVNAFGEDEELTWTGEFDIPVRFDTDEFKALFSSGLPTMDGTQRLSEVYFDLQSLPLVELREDD